MQIFRWSISFAAIFLSSTLGFADVLRVTVAEYSKGTGPYFNEAARSFEEKHPGVNVQIEVVPWDNLQQKLVTDISADRNADLAIVGTRWLLDYVSQGIVAPLDQYETPEFKSRFVSTFLAPSVMNGKTYGLPIAASARAMYYNKNLFQSIGLDGPPSTWPDFTAAIKKIKAGHPDVFPFGLQGKEIETDVYFYYGLWSFGGDMVQNGASGIGSDASISAAKLYRSFIEDSLAEPGVTSYSREDVQNLFKVGKVATVITAPFLSSQLKAEAPTLQYGIAPIPTAVGGKPFTYGVTDSIVLFQNSKHKDAAWQFLDFLFTTEQRVKFDKIEGFLPVNVQEAADPYFADNADLKVFTALLPYAHFAPVIRGTDEISQTTINAVQTVYLGKAPIEATMKDAAKRIDGVLKSEN